MPIINKKYLIITILSCMVLQNLVNFDCFSYDQLKETVLIPEKSMKQPPLLLRFLYTNGFGKIVKAALTKRWVNILAGIYCNLSVSKYHIASFVREHAINMDEAQRALESYSSFNDFFIRKLTPEARPIFQNGTVITSPADGGIIVFEDCSNEMNFPVKECSFNLSQFLNNEQLASYYQDGTIMIFRLAPYDYHRYHFPTDCTPSPTQIIPGLFESVHPLAYLTGIQPLTQNERHLTLLHTNSCGLIGMVSVGALCVGKIIETYQPLKAYKKGEEVGYFCFGGSTVVLLFKKGTITVDQELLDNSKQGIETPIKMGMPIGTNYFCSIKKS